MHIVHKRPKKGNVFSAADVMGSVNTSYDSDEARFTIPTLNLQKHLLPELMGSLGLFWEPLPLLWTVDLINSSDYGTGPPEEKWAVSALNCACVDLLAGIGTACCRDGVMPDAYYSAVPSKDLEEAKRISDLMGEKALAILV